MEGKEKKTNRFVIQTVKILVFIIAVIAAIRFAGVIYVTHDNNMYPALKDGDFLVSWKLGGYFTGDPVLYVDQEYAIKNEKIAGVLPYLKTGRIIGMPGDEINITDQGFTVNGNIPYESIYSTTMPADNPDIIYPVVLKSGEYFILNDDREDFSDSRTYGPVTEAQLQGKCVFIMRHRGI